MAVPGKTRTSGKSNGPRQPRKPPTPSSTPRLGPGKACQFCNSKYQKCEWGKGPPGLSSPCKACRKKGIECKPQTIRSRQRESKNATDESGSWASTIDSSSQSISGDGTSDLSMHEGSMTANQFGVSESPGGNTRAEEANRSNGNGFNMEHAGNIVITHTGLMPAYQINNLAPQRPSLQERLHSEVELGSIDGGSEVYGPSGLSTSNEINDSLLLGRSTEESQPVENGWHYQRDEMIIGNETSISPPEVFSPANPSYTPFESTDDLPSSIVRTSDESLGPHLRKVSKSFPQTEMVEKNSEEL